MSLFYIENKVSSPIADQKLCKFGDEWAQHS